VPEGVIDDYTIAKLTHPKPGINYASEGDMRAGKHLELIPEHSLMKPMPQAHDVTPEMIEQHITRMPPPVWQYHRAGHDLPHTLEHHGGGKYSLDGNPLSLDELHKIRDNVRSKAATLRYKGAGVADTIAKMEQKFANLMKEEDIHPADALRRLEAAQRAGHVSEGDVNALRRHIFTDPMTGGVMGNQFSYNDFRKQPRPGVHIAMDGNDFKAINDLYGHKAGDQAIKSFGRAAREAMDEAVGQKSGKLFRNPDDENLYRNGGDEFAAHVPTHAHAAQFARALRNKLDSLPPIAGQHKLSMSFGFGNDPDSADAALYEAKKQKYQPGLEGAPKQRAFGIGQVPSLAHSFVPGFEGAVPLSPEKLPQIKLPEGMKVEPTQPEEAQAAPTPPPLPTTPKTT
jgi:GGDEF domain-containing protein